MSADEIFLATNKHRCVVFKICAPVCLIKTSDFNCIHTLQKIVQND